MIFRGRNTGLNDVLVGREARFLGEEPGKVVGTQGGDLRQLLQLYGLRKVVRDIGQGQADAVVALLFLRQMGRQQQRKGQHDADGLAGLINGQMAAEVPVNFPDLVMHGSKLRDTDHRTEERRNMFIISPCQYPVKVHPEAGKTAVGAVFMLPVAVQQHQIALLRTVMLSVQMQEAFPFCNGHDEEAVELLPVDAVAAFIVELSDDGGIEKKLLCGQRGGMEIVVRAGLHQLFGTEHGDPFL